MPGARLPLQRHLEVDGWRPSGSRYHRTIGVPSAMEGSTSLWRVYSGRLRTAQRQPKRRSKMTVKVEVREGEAIQEALRRLRHAVRHEYRRQWHKTRPGSYDKPSYRRRPQEALRRRNRRRCGRPGTTTVYVGLSELFARRAPFTYSRRPKRLKPNSITEDCDD